jgi:hypothetical protein
MTPEEFWNILHAAPEPHPIFYRLYYDDQGFPLFYSMEDLPGNYIDIDKETYSQSSSYVRVRDGRLIRTSINTSRKLVPSTNGVACHPNDVAIVGDSFPNRWAVKTYDSEN